MKSKISEEYEKFSRYKYEKLINQVQSSLCQVCQLHAFLNLWKVIVHGTFLNFSPISYQKIPHCVIVANGSKVPSQEDGQVS